MLVWGRFPATVLDYPGNSCLNITTTSAHSDEFHKQDDEMHRILMEEGQEPPDDKSTVHPLNGKTV